MFKVNTFRYECNMSYSALSFLVQVISTLYFLGCIVNTMSHYNGPKLDTSRLHRNPDGIIAVKVGVIIVNVLVLYACRYVIIFVMDVDRQKTLLR